MKQTLRTFRLSAPLYNLTFSIYYLLTSKTFRKDRWTQIKYRQHCHQPNSNTGRDRYPDLFRICQEYFSEQTNIKILSFGCSRGDEVFSLSEYLPDAKIIGVDISDFSLAQAKQKNANPNCSFYHSLSPEFLNSYDYTAVFCLAVLQHEKNQGNTPIARRFTFQRFEQQLVELDRKLVIGGLLFIDNCDFIFQQTTIAKRYSPLEVPSNFSVCERPLYGSDNRRITKNTRGYRVFVKNFTQKCSDIFPQ